MSPEARLHAPLVVAEAYGDGVGVLLGRDVAAVGGVRGARSTPALHTCMHACMQRGGRDGLE